MNTNYIPNTSVEAEVIDHPVGNDYVSLYLQANETGNSKNVASVNAGTSNPGEVFSVGLGGINGSFAKALRKAGQDAAAYQNLHQAIYDAAGTNLSGIQNSFAATDPIRFSLMLKPDPSFNLPQYDGIVFIDVFNVNQLPKGNPLNYSMIYLVPPQASYYPDDAAFQSAVEASCITILKALEIYNTIYAVTNNINGLETIEDVRMCLFSGGYYRGAATQDSVALSNLKGLEKGILALNKAASANWKIYFENSFDNKTQQDVFRVIQAKLATSPS